MREEKDVNYGHKPLTGTYEDLVAAGVIDPTKVVRHALQNATSVAGLLLTTEAVVVEKPQDDKASALPGGDMVGCIRG